MSAVEAGTLGTFVTAALRTAEPSVPADPQRNGLDPVSAGMGREPQAGRRRGTRAGRTALHCPGRAAEPHRTSTSGKPPAARCRPRALLALHGQASTINNRPAWVGFYTGRLQDLGVVVVEAAHVVLGDQVYLVAGLTPFAAYETARHEFFAAISSFGSEPGIGRRPVADRRRRPARRTCSTWPPCRRCRLRNLRKAVVPHAGSAADKPTASRAHSMDAGSASSTRRCSSTTSAKAAASSTRSTTRRSASGFLSG